MQITITDGVPVCAARRDHCGNFKKKEVMHRYGSVLPQDLLCLPVENVNNPNVGLWKHSDFSAGDQALLHLKLLSH